MSDEKRYRTEIPNIIDDLGLDPHERALYVHYKRSCGGNDCEWVESARVTGQKTKMSHTRASTARKSLVDRGLVCLVPKGNDGTAIRVIDIWELNTLFYQDKHRPDIDGWTINQLKEHYPGVNIIYTLEQEEPSNSETEGVGVNNVNTSVNNMNNKKEPIKKELEGKEENSPIPEKSLSPSQKMFTVLAEVCRCNIKLMRGQLNKAEKELREAGVTPETIKAFGKWWYGNDFRGKQDQPPTLKQVKETLGQFEAFQGQPALSTLPPESIPAPSKPELTPEEKILERFKERASNRIPGPQWREHIAPMRVVGCPNGKIQVEVNRFTKELIEGRFNKVLEPIALELNPEGGFEYVVT